MVIRLLLSIGVSFFSSHGPAMQPDRAMRGYPKEPAMPSIKK
jgi:hypothetical protein